jgi:uncharacterized protein (TIGR01777 family)
MAAMKIAMTGSSGLIGSALRTSLNGDGHRVVRLVRRAATGPDEVRIDPRVPVDPGVFADVDAVVNLAGAGVGDHRWSPAYKRTIRHSRIGTTTAIVRALQSAPTRRRTLLSASAIGYYGDDNGDALLMETAPAGADFLATVCRDWEAATTPARAAGVRTVQVRTGLVLDRSGGALAPMLKLFRFGLGGRLGSGGQFWSTISMDDHIRALRFLLASPDASGAFNLTAPEPATNANVTKALGRVLHRPTVLAVPAFALRAALGQFSSGVLGSARVVPERLLAADFTFRHPTIDSQLRAVLAD